MRTCCIFSKSRQGLWMACGLGVSRCLLFGEDGWWRWWWPRDPFTLFVKISSDLSPQLLYTTSSSENCWWFCFISLNFLNFSCFNQNMDLNVHFMKLTSQIAFQKVVLYAICVNLPSKRLNNNLSFAWMPWDAVSQALLLNEQH